MTIPACLPDRASGPNVIYSSLTWPVVQYDGACFSRPSRRAALTTDDDVLVVSSGTNENLTVDAKGSGTITFGATSTGAVQFSRAAVPTADDGVALGSASLRWSDLFLAEGGVITWDNGINKIFRL